MVLVWVFGGRLHLLWLASFPEAQFAVSVEPNATLIGEDDILELLVVFGAFCCEFQSLDSRVWFVR